MFRADDGFFHFVFANQDDDYYMSAYIKMQFQPYLRYQILNQGYRYIYFLGTEQKKDNEYWLRCVGGVSRDALESEQKKGFLASFMKRDTTADELTNRDYNIDEFELSNYEAFRTSFLKILDLMKRKNNVALVLPVGLFALFNEDTEIIEKISPLTRKNRDNILVLTTSVEAAQNDIYFKNKKYIFPKKKEEIGNTGIFYNKRIFAEILECFDSDASTTTRIVCTYDVLKDKYGDRMQVWNDMAYETVRTAVRYYFLHDMPFESFGKAEDYANVVWLWYNDWTFRDRFCHIKFSPNPRRSMRVVIDDLRRYELQQEIESIIAENSGEFQQHLQKADCTEPIYIVRADSGIVSLLRRFRMLDRRHEVLSEEECAELLEIIDFFNKPFYISCHNKGDLMYTHFSERNELKKFFDYLANQNEWNCWDCCMVRILFVLFQLCGDEALQTVEEDRFNSLNLTKLDKGMEALKHCMKKSESGNTDQGEAFAFEREIVERMNLVGDAAIARIRGYRIQENLWT